MKTLRAENLIRKFAVSTAQDFNKNRIATGNFPKNVVKFQTILR